MPRRLNQTHPPYFGIDSIMGKRCNVLPDRSSRMPIGKLGSVVTKKRALRSTDVNVSAVFNRSSTCKIPDTGLMKATALGGVLEEATTSRVARGRRVKPHLRRSRDQGLETSRDKSLSTAVSVALSHLNTRIQVLSGELDQLMAFERLVLLSQHELLVVTQRKIFVLHSVIPLTREGVSRFGALKLAVNSQCYYVLYNDVVWFMRWKFF